jgi:hypothetical protein
MRIDLRMPYLVEAPALDRNAVIIWLRVAEVD